MNRITTLDHMILRDEGRGKSDTFIYTVPKVNKVKAYCKLGKLEDIMEHFNIDSIDNLVEVLEAWEVVKQRLEIYSDGIINLKNDFWCPIFTEYTSNGYKDQYQTLKKAIEVSNVKDKR